MSRIFAVISLDSATLPLLLALYLVTAIGTLCTWRVLHVNSTTGDEPHYLVMASGIAYDFTLEQSAPYEREFRERTIYYHGLAPPDAKASEANTFAFLGPHGLYNVHAPGLPIYLALPYRLGGVVGARLAMIASGTAIVLLAWFFGGETISDRRQRLLIMLPLSIALPLVPTANQVYPELPAAAICLVGLWALLRIGGWTQAWTGWIVGALLATLPWFHLRFSAPLFLIAAALVVRLWPRADRWRWIAAILVPTVISFATYTAYNEYAFGRLMGPYRGDALVLDSKAIMAFFGLWIDQNQGILVQQPLHLAGLLFLGAYCRRDRVLGLTVVLLLLSLLLPNSMHPTRYGGFSFSGRFGWTASAILLPVTLYALGEAYRASRRWSNVLLAASAGIQVYYLALVIPGTVTMHRRVPDWIDSYSILWKPLTNSLPAFYDRDWAFDYVPNGVGAVFLLAITLLGATYFRDPPSGARAAGSITAATVVALLLFGRYSEMPRPPLVWPAPELPSRLGVVEGGARVARPPDPGGYLSFGPYSRLARGRYVASLTYRSPEPVGSVVGTFDVYLSESNTTVKEMRIMGSKGALVTVQLHFSQPRREPKLTEFRVYYGGTGTLTEYVVTLRGVRFGRMTRPTLLLPPPKGDGL